MCKMMLRISRKERRFATGALGILGLAAKGLVDTIAICTGLNYRLLRHRALAIKQDEESEWRSVWEQVRLVSGNLGNGHRLLNSGSRSS